MTNHNPGDTSPAPVPAPTGLKAQLHHLLPRHALFRVRITIRQLASVPLVHGEFGVRWKFKNTHKVKGKGKEKVSGPEHEHEHEHENDDDDDDSFGSADISSEDPQTLAHTRIMPSPSSVLDPADDAQASASVRGQTPWLPLRDHSVTWDQPLSAVVQMSIDRDTHRLLPHPFKLSVMQRVIAHDPDAPHNPRLGVVELDLAEYADSVPVSPPSKGVVTRRYLLRDSKTNATLRLSIRVEPVSTAVWYIAPPLPNGEILAGVATLLTTHDEVYRTRPRALDLYAPVESHVNSTKTSLKSKRSSQSQAFDIHALPRAYGPRPTESLIEALFNPTPVREERLVSPFTKMQRADSGDSYQSPASFTRTSSRASTAMSFQSVSASSGYVSPFSGPVSVAPSFSGQSSLAPSGRVSVHSRSSSMAPSVAPSISHSENSTRQSAPNTDSDGESRHWWQRSRVSSRGASRAGSVAVA
ncbi:N-terminal C2 in EEIG1 and EHBP1 proteins-domain-containing protein [Mycena pura]|uniref:N-terminal C2 in EEIG1 and EHBP1 proteins-domain-containing protein n=1 Tax=Mycena pura TaxID=153505 RepID=A0AAD6YJQ4_9AGAR|nr:N-terminal C2 in EEIG1 and EHBP1 proteins-domain-containing protein [Mycena pura]